jgi:citrate lyase subunit beta/citryl-CoA lyase
VGSIRLLALIETPKGIINAYEIANSSYRILGVTFGAEDYALEMGINRTKEGAEIYYPRMVLSLACHAVNTLAIDCVFTDVRDREGLTKETKLVRQMGFQGKLVIHPDQVDPVNEIFTPSEDETAHARKVVEAFEVAVAQGQASTSLDGKMIDAPVAERARKLLFLAESIAKRERDKKT